MARSKSSAVRITKADKMNTAARLRRAGLTLQEIADQIGTDKSTVSRYCRELVDTLHAEALRDIDAWKSAQLAELQEMRNEVWNVWRNEYTPKQLGDDRVNVKIRDAGLMRVILQAQEREAKLLGFEQTVAAVGPAFVMTDERAAEILADMNLT